MLDDLPSRTRVRLPAPPLSYMPRKVRSLDGDFFDACFDHVSIVNKQSMFYDQGADIAKQCSAPAPPLSYKPRKVRSLDGAFFCHNLNLGFDSLIGKVRI